MNNPASSATLCSHRLAEILRPVFPRRTFKSYQQLHGGYTNTNLLLRFEQDEAPVVMRIYGGGASAWQRELNLLIVLGQHLQVPEIIHADEKGDYAIGPYALYPYIEGITFQELKSRGNREDMAQAAFAVGEVLACVRTVAVPPFLSSSSPYGAVDEFLNSPILVRRVGARGIDRLQSFLVGWLPQIGYLHDDNRLVHGDFNNRNTLLHQQGDRWRVASILDWELAFCGSPLWDVARFICYERKARPCREPHFSDGYRSAGGRLPENWDSFASVINAVSAAYSLSRPDLSERFIPDLCQVIAQEIDGS
jgi:aminoglycoside phosphotransferase (APT) family kinase protein